MKYVRVEAPKPDPYPLTEEGYQQAIGWIRNSGMSSWAAEEFGERLHESVLPKKMNVVVTKVNLMRGCW